MMINHDKPIGSLGSRWFTNLHDGKTLRPPLALIFSKHIGSNGLMTCLVVLPSGNLLHICIAMENDHLWWVFQIKMVIFHSYVSLTEGNHLEKWWSSSKGRIKLPYMKWKIIQSCLKPPTVVSFFLGLHINALATLVQLPDLSRISPDQSLRVAI